MTQIVTLTQWHEHPNIVLPDDIVQGQLFVDFFFLGDQRSLR